MRCLVVLFACCADHPENLQTADRTPATLCDAILPCGSDSPDDPVVLSCCNADSVTCWYTVEDGTRWECNPFDQCAEAWGEMCEEVCGGPCQ